MHQSIMKKATLSDISKYTGVSITTVSRVLTGKSEQFRISAETEKKVLEAVKALKYKPNFFAQSLRKSTSYTLGLLIPSIDNPFFANIASAVIREAHKYDYPVMLIDTHESVVEEKSAIETLLGRNVDGIIMVPCTDDPEQLLKLNQNKPLVLIDRYFEDCELSYVATDNYRGAYDATRLLLSQGHRKIMCIQGTPRSITSRQRVKGFIDAVNDAGCADCATVTGNDFSTSNGYVETKLALSTGQRPSAIFALSNTIMLGAMKAISEHGLSIPGDISIISFDDNIYLDFLNPPVTRISQPIEEISIVAVKMLMDRINGRTENCVTSCLLQPTMVIRSSVSLPPVDNQADILASRYNLETDYTG